MTIVTSRVLAAYSGNLLAISDNSLEEILNHLRDLKEVLEQNLDFSDYFLSHYLSTKEKKFLLSQIVGGSNINSKLLLLLELMIDNKDLNLLFDLYNYLERQFLINQGLLSVKVVTACTVPQKLRKDFISIIEGIFQQKVVLSYEVDQSVIGGILFISEDFLVDFTFKKQIHRLKEAFNIQN